MGTGGEAYDVMVRLSISRRWPVWAINTCVTIFTHASQAASTVKDGSNPSRRTEWVLVEKAKKRKSSGEWSRRVDAGWRRMECSPVCDGGRRLGGWRIGRRRGESGCKVAADGKQSPDPVRLPLPRYADPQRP